jgi:hypothetical protein
MAHRLPTRASEEDLSCPFVFNREMFCGMVDVVGLGAL